MEQSQGADQAGVERRPPDPPDGPPAGADGHLPLPAPALGQSNSQIQNGAQQNEIVWNSWMQRSSLRQAELEQERQRRKAIREARQHQSN